MKSLDIRYNSHNALEKHLSNLFPRSFHYAGRDYRSIEHAYQTWKSGDFDSTAYNALGLKPKGTKRVNKAVNLQVMIELIYQNLSQYPDFCEILKRLNYLRDFKISHSVGSKFWKKAFVDCLRSALERISKDYE